MKQPDGTLTIASEQAQLSEARLRDENKRLWERVNLAERRTDLHLLQVQELSRTISRLERENAELRAALSACAPETDEVQS